MQLNTYPKFKAAAIQAAPVWLYRDATINKIEALTKQAASAGATLVAFPEAFLPSYPVWDLILRPSRYATFYRRLYDNAIVIPSPSFNKLSEIARQCHVYLSIGVSEHAERSWGTLYNSNLIFDTEGRLINWHRKLVPTLGEKLTYGPGDASGLKAVETDIGRIGVLLCGENVNTLARFALLSQGEQVHIMTFSSFWYLPNSHKLESEKATQLAVSTMMQTAGAHSFEGKVFTLVSCGLLDEEAKKDLAQGDEEAGRILDAGLPRVSMIVGPSGLPVGEPLIAKEGIAYGDIDLSQAIEPKLLTDITGAYQRFDLFQLSVDRTPYTHEGVRFQNLSGGDPLASIATLPKRTNEYSEIDQTRGDSLAK